MNNSNTSKKNLIHKVQIALHFQEQFTTCCEVHFLHYFKSGFLFFARLVPKSLKHHGDREQLCWCLTVLRAVGGPTQSFPGMVNPKLGQWPATTGPAGWKQSVCFLTSEKRLSQLTFKGLC